MILLHATCIAFEGTGVLLRGPSGAGKSDLALRAVDAGACLVADDQVVVALREGDLHASPPEAIAGLLEVRGLGLQRMPYLHETRVGLVVDLVERDRIDRLPESRSAEIAGVRLPAIALAAFEPSTLAKLRLVARTMAGRARLGLAG